MTTDERIAQLEANVQALRYWLRVLWFMTAPETGADADRIERIIVRLKNAGPEDAPWIRADLFDQYNAAFLPAIERYGRDLMFALSHSETQDLDPSLD